MCHVEIIELFVFHSDFDLLTVFIYYCYYFYYQEKAPYVAKSDKRKVEYEKLMKAYNLKQVSPL